LSKKLRGFQKKYLRGLAHHMKPVVFVGQRGVTDAVARSAEEALEKHELIKLKFIDAREKDQKRDMIAKLEEMTGAELVGMIGHTGILFRQQSDPEKRRVIVPDREPPGDSGP